MEGSYDLDHLLANGHSRVFRHEVWVSIASFSRCRKCDDRRAQATGCYLSHFSRWYCIECFAEVAESMHSADTAQSAYWNPVIGFTRRDLRGEFVSIDSDPDGIAEFHIDYDSDGWMHSVTREGSSRISPSLIAHWRRRCLMQKMLHTCSLMGFTIDPSAQLDIDRHDIPRSNFDYAMEDQLRQRHDAQIGRLDAELLEADEAMIREFAALGG